MGVTKHRTKVSVKGDHTFEANAVMTAGSPGAVINNANTTLGTADLNGVNGGIVLRRQASGSPCLAFRLNGTVYGLFFAQAGGAVSGTPVT